MWVDFIQKHYDCAFLSFTNGTLVDETFCADLKRVGNLYLAISLEGFAEVNDLRRGEGVYGKVMHAMDLLKQNGLVFGTSICYISAYAQTDKMILHIPQAISHLPSGRFVFAQKQISV